MSDEPRVIADRYELGDVIGRGGMADVYRGRDPLLNRDVAIKLLRVSLSGDPKFRSRFRQEAQAAARMTHPTVVKVFDAGEQSEREADGEETIRPYIVMEFLEGTLLQERLRGGALAEKEAARIIGGVLTALEYSHKAGVVHRDIKPGNIMITNDGDVKVMDFGIARAATETAANVAETTAILGTAQYFSPEQAQGAPVDERTDLYSAGVVLYELLTGAAPFQGETAVAIAYQHVREEPEAPRSIEPGISKAMDAVVLRALRKEPGARFASAAEFRSAVEKALDGVLPEEAPAAVPGSAGGPLAFGDPGLGGSIVDPDAFDEELDAEFAGLLAGGNDTEQQMRAIAAQDAAVPLTQKGPPVTWLWGGILSVLAILGALVFWLTTLGPIEFGNANAVEVPDLVAVAADRAEEDLIELGFTVRRSYEFDAEVAEGGVARTNPEAGESMSPGSSVELVISRGTQTVTVPSLSGQTVDEATATLAALGITVESTTAATSPNVAADRVIDSVPAAREQVAIGGSVVLNVSNGRVELPSLVNVPLADARRTLSDLRLTAEAASDPGCPIASGNPITAQSVAPGQVDQGATVRITYCIGAG